MGLKPLTIPRDFDAPTIWATLGILSSRMNHLLENFDQHVKKRAKQVVIQAHSSTQQDIQTLSAKQDLNKRTLVAISTAIQNLQNRLVGL